MKEVNIYIEIKYKAFHYNLIIKNKYLKPTFKIPEQINKMKVIYKKSIAPKTK
jgi:hypothetical protein